MVLAALLHTGLVTPSPVLIAYAFYGVIVAGLLLAWRFHSSRIFLALLILFLAQQAVTYFTQGRINATGPGSTALAALGLLLPLNFVLLSFEQEKGFIFSSIAPAGLLLFVESVIVAVLCRPNGTAALRGRLNLLPDSRAIRRIAQANGRGQEQIFEFAKHFITITL